MRPPTRTLRACALLTPWLLAATACGPPGFEPPPPVLPEVEPDGPAERSRELERYDANARHRTAAVGSEDLVRWRGVSGLAASDATTNTVYLIDLDTAALMHRIPFEEGARPGRLASTADTVYAVLQGTGELARIDERGRVTGRVKVCRAPRGVAVDTPRSRVWVACASSEVVGVDMETFEVASTWFGQADLRDIVAMGPKLYVSRFHSAQIVIMDAETGEVTDRRFPAKVGSTSGRDGSRVGTLWRMKRNGDTLILSYQRTAADPLLVDKRENPEETPPEEQFVGGYGGGVSPFDREGVACTAAVVSMVGVIQVDGQGDVTDVHGSCSPAGPVPVDVGPTGCGILALSASMRLTAPRRFDEDPHGANVCLAHLSPSHSALAMEQIGSDDLYVLTRGESLSVRGPNGTKIVLAEDSRAHLGHALFHGDSGQGIACASCHPGGGSDGHTWTFHIMGDDEMVRGRTRRTQTLRAGVEGRLHWDGEFEGMTELMGDVFSRRMGGFAIEDADASAVRDWLGQLKPDTGITPPPERADQVTRGAEVFAEANCGACHSGENLTDHRFHDVGTDGPLKTPSLRGVVHFKDFLHNGCADTLRARFDQDCGGDRHGDVEGLTGADLDALITYLETL